MKDSQSIYKKIEKSATHRGLEADLVSNIIENTHHPKIVCGDFNSIPSSYVYFRIRQNMKDAFLEKGLGIGPTYIGTFPILRIDYLLHSSKIETQSFENIQVNYSDHYPLFANFKLL
jgi:endonuclease/exonuclease/phosphatase family metal-dependent hydrolase